MENIVNLMDYKEAKGLGISMKALTEQRFVIQKHLNEEFLEDLEGEYFVHDMREGDVWPEGYEFILAEDLANGKYDNCDHLEWKEIEKGYQATCNSCGLNSWSAPW